MRADVSEGFEDVRPQFGRGDFERLRGAALPVGRGSQQLPGGNDADDTILGEERVISRDGRGAGGIGPGPGTVAGLILPGRNIVAGRIERRGGHDRRLGGGD